MVTAVRTILASAMALGLAININAGPVPAVAQLSTLPETSAANPSGQHQFMIFGNDAEENTLIHVFEQTSQGDIEVSTREAQLDNNGYFRIPVSVSSFSANKTFSYFVTYQKTIIVTTPGSSSSPIPSGTPAPSSHPAGGGTSIETKVLINVKSDPIKFYFSPSKTLPAPEDITIENLESGARKLIVFSKSGGGSVLSTNSAGAVAKAASGDFNVAPVLDPTKSFKIKWTPVANAQKYVVYKRLSLGGSFLENLKCKNLDNCYLDTPYEKIGETTSATFVDGALCATAPCSKSASYFVIAQKLTEQSARSKNVVVNDLSAPASLRRSRMISKPSSSGENRKIDLNYCLNARPFGFFGADIDLDLSAFVAVTKKTSASCNNQIFSSTERYDFDGLYTRSAAELWSYPCVPVSSITSLQPETTYCVRSCLADRSGNEEATDLQPSSSPTPFANCQFNQVTTAKKALSPLELSGVKPMPSGSSLEVQWKILNADFIATQEIKNFVVEWSDTLDNRGDPLFSDAQKIALATITDRSYTIEGLNTNHNYCVRVKALSQNNDPVEPTQAICVNTLDNRIRVESLTAAPFSASDTSKLAIRFYVINPNPTDAKDKIEFVKLELRMSGNLDWSTVSEEDLSLPENKLLKWDRLQSDNSFNEIALDSYFFGNKSVDFRITIQRQNDFASQTGNSTSESGSSETSSFTPTPIYSDMGNQSSYTNSSVIGCTLNASGGPFKSVGSILFMIAGLFLIWGLRRSNKVDLETK